MMHLLIAALIQNGNNLVHTYKEEKSGVAAKIFMMPARYKIKSITVIKFLS